MPAAGPVPREPPPRRFEVAPHRARGEHGEREQERRRLAADEEQPPSGDGGVVLHGAKLLDRRLDAEAPRGGGESGTRALARPDEAVDLPQARLPGGERPDPRVAAVRVRDGRCPRQGPDSLRHDERGGRRPVITGCLLQDRCDLTIVEGVVGRRQKIPEELARAERARADLDEPEPRRIRQRALSSQP